jgi:hypothetical protein
MSIKIVTLVAMGWCFLPSVAQAALEFCGYTVISGVASFSLEDTADKTSSPWIPVGKAFRGYKITAFDAGKELLSVETPEGRTTQLALRSASVKDAKIRISGSIKIGIGESVEVNRATLVMGEETVFALKNGVTLRLKPTPFEGNIRYDAVFEKQEPDGTKKVLSSPVVLARPNQPFQVEIGELGFAFEP